MRKILLTISLVLIPYCCFAQSNVSISNLRKHVRTLASDDFYGRAPMTKGEYKTINYIVNEFKNIGIDPGNKGSFLQNVPLGNVETNPSSIVIKSNDSKKNITLKFKEDFVVKTIEVIPKINIKEKNLIFVGHGIDAPQYGWNDYKNINVKDKIVIALFNDPGYGSEKNTKTLFKGKDLTYYGTWLYKLDQIVKRGAAGIFIIHDEELMGNYQWKKLVTTVLSTQYQLDEEKEKRKVTQTFYGWINSRAANKIFSAAGYQYIDVKKNAKSISHKSFDLPFKATFDIHNNIEHGVSHNVIGMIKGKSRQNEYIVYCAHWDHLGTDGEKIYNGAIDNATGISGLIELARNFKYNINMLERSLLFVAFTAEESECLGSKYFINHPPIEKKELFIANINMDALNVLEVTKEMVLIGKGQSTLEDLLYQETISQGRMVIDDPVAETGLFFRSDHLYFVRAGIPSLAFMNIGINDKDYVQNRYHTPNDTYNPNWGMLGMKADLEIIFNIGYQLSQKEIYPKWKKNSEFKIFRY